MANIGRDSEIEGMETCPWNDTRTEVEATGTDTCHDHLYYNMSVIITMHHISWVTCMVRYDNNSIHLRPAVSGAASALARCVQRPKAHTARILSLLLLRETVRT